MSFLFYDVILCIIFFVATGFFLYHRRKNVKREGILFLYRTKFGLRFVDKLVKRYSKFFSSLSIIFIVISFIGMAAIIIMLIASCYKLAVMPTIIRTPPIVPLLPWIPIPGLPTLYFT